MHRFRFWPWVRRAAWLAFFLLALALGVLLVRAFEARSKPELMPWHRLVLDQEVHAATLGAHATWAQYLQHEQRLFDELRADLAAAPVAGRLRYEKDSRIGAMAGSRDWNRSFESTPAAPRMCRHPRSPGSRRRRSTTTTPPTRRCAGRR